MHLCNRRHARKHTRRSPGPHCMTQAPHCMSQAPHPKHGPRPPATPYQSPVTRIPVPFPPIASPAHPQYNSHGYGGLHSGGEGFQPVRCVRCPRSTGPGSAGQLSVPSLSAAESDHLQQCLNLCMSSHACNTFGMNRFESLLKPYRCMHLRITVSQVEASGHLEHLWRSGKTRGFD